MDIPVSITAMSYSGNASTLNVTLKKAATTDTFTLMAPSYDVAVNETKEIPFVAYDQNGAKITKWSDLTSAGISFSPVNKVTLEENVDGTAKLMVGPFTANGPQVITAMTSTGKISTLTLNVQKQATAATLSVDSSVLVSAMQTGAMQDADFGYIGGNGGLSVKDQYGRTVDMVGDAGTYYVSATVSGNVTATTGHAASGTGITIGAGAPGSGTVTFNLYDSGSATPNAVLDTKSVSFSVVQNADIKGYTIDAVTNALYTASAISAVSATGRPSDYYANPYVFGTTASGTKVVLAGSPVTGAVSTSTSFFATQGGGYDSVKVFADKFSDYAKTTGSGTLTVTILGADQKVHTVTTAISSTTASPVASTVAASVNTAVSGISQDGDTVTVDLVANQDALIAGQTITRFKNTATSDGALATNLVNHLSATVSGRAPVYLYAKDQYGTKAMMLAQISKVAGSSTVSDAGFNVDSLGVISLDKTAIANGQYADITAVSTNGLVKTIRIKFVTSTTLAQANLKNSIVAATAASVGKTEGPLAGDTITGSGATLTSAISAATSALGAYAPATPITAATIAAADATLATAKTTLDAAVVAYNAAVVKVVSAPVIAGVTVPVKGATPTATITATTEYTAAISWAPTGTFAGATAYTATIVITPKAGYILTGVTANFFTVAGATATNTAGSGTVTAVFPVTAN